MPSPTVLYLVAALSIVGLFTWVGLVWKNVQASWDASPEERAKHAAKPAEVGTKKKPAKAKADEAKADEAKADEAKADEAKADEAKADETKADETDAKAEAKADEAKAG